MYILNNLIYKFSLVQHKLLLQDSQRAVWDVADRWFPVTITHHLYIHNFLKHLIKDTNTHNKKTSYTKQNSIQDILPYTRKFWWGIKIGKSLAKFSALCTDCCLFAKFFLANSFYLYDSPKFSPTKYFPCTVSVLQVSMWGCALYLNISNCTTWQYTVRIPYGTKLWQ